MAYYNREPEITNMIKSHERRANRMLQHAQSSRLLEAFNKIWVSIENKELPNFVSKNVVNFNVADIKSEINDWIKDLKDCQENARRKFESMEDPSPEDIQKRNNITSDVVLLISQYENLKNGLDQVEQDFSNVARTHRAPMREALTDISILYNSVNHVKGDFSDYKNVSVYVHGIEDSGNGFYESVQEAAKKGDLIVRIMDDGTKIYCYIDKNGKKHETESYEEIKEVDKFNTNGRLHIVYDTDYMNEHRQATSDDLAEKLNEMGLMNDTTKIDMFGHSYGGRRSLQFAMDYPDHVRSITTIGTPYDKNLLATGANRARWLADNAAGRNTTDTSDYLDFNEENKNNDNGKDYSNAYTDMDSEAMTEDINHLKSANPEVYQKLQKMDITAAAGYRTEDTVSFSPYYTASGKHKINSDDIVSVESQHGDILGDLIDEKPEFEVEGSGVTNSGHIHEIRDSDFIDLIRKVNKKEAE
ncbi:alpha/beta fold hydrolase [Bacillus paralicheniformis]|uniref:alpha/beta fold hydrolase n=1 Tax=Bacillus paralicheniformis TaxID=1648923 RepID=UPI002243046F|nr:alpha/beta fold hydrolase [Bacillus paralicheniformis]MEC1021064.1 alpha/beta fold hydrolase [Bacillus paralicheniformis]MEC1027705.1 alpha/beta fold hydrolase [Bacillus paralicheniformis]MEC1033347.1 alpha/beta fold hydrolase [Bacillus paralicheniformis]MEC1051072.1 alpha/beta fold hydrolase [Bacillus paralicheniformis]MEC1060675.1 alpha/beta fold hydrolase [Bacillus paralicheniformis]